MKIATYNINSIRARSGYFFNWLAQTSPDIIFLQEIKCETENFLYFECESLGYKVAVLGQKGYNGVAILSKYDFEITAKNLPDFLEDDSSRYLEILVKKEEETFYAASIYAPNGCSSDKHKELEKFNYKLYWYDKLYERAQALLASGRPVMFCGDFNIIMEDIDVYNGEHFKGSPLYRKEVYDKIKALELTGLYDSYRLLYPNKEGYTFWDYSGNSFVTNSGLRIDYIFVTASLAERLNDVNINKALRAVDKPSDHTVLTADFKD